MSKNKNKTFEIILLILIFFTFHSWIIGQTKNTASTYTVTVRINSKDSTFKIKTQDLKEKFMTELWVSDPECTECKDCFVDSGDVKIPEVLKQYVKRDESTWGKDLILTCKNPYKIENTFYVNYKIIGHVTGIYCGYLLFCVDKWKRRE